ncbi:MAG: putative LPLAT superfamily acyltransferase, partial [Pseudoalteromonas tetraodonis]
ERDGDLQDYYEKKADRQGSEEFSVSYNTPGEMLGVDLVRMLGRGEVVALQGDRVMGEVAPAEALVCGEMIKLPEGPHVLALASRSSIFPLFILRVGWRRYRILALPPLDVPRRERGIPKSEVIGRSVDGWGAVLTSVLNGHWDQWLEFGTVFNEEGVEEE